MLFDLLGWLQWSAVRLNCFRLTELGWGGRDQMNKKEENGK